MDIYRKLGLKTIINASDTYTIIGGSRMDPEVLDAMCEASKRFVDLNELLDAVCARIAELTGNDAAFVTTGAAAGVVLSAAACMTGAREDLISKIPDTCDFPRNEFVLFEGQCTDINPYWRFIRHAGGRIIQAGPSVDAMDAAIGEKTAGIFYFAGTLYEDGVPAPEEVIRLAQSRGIPVIVDAAAQLPPAGNLWRYTRALGADLALFSGGKFIMGPQSSGILLGKRPLIEACRLHGFPNANIGRPFKLGKEEMAALLTAVERLVESDPDRQTEQYNKILDTIERGITGLPGVGTSRTDRGRLGQTIPLLMIHLPAGKDSLACHAYLRASDPAVDIGYFHGGDPSVVFVNPINLREGEEDIVTECLRKYFLEA